MTPTFTVNIQALISDNDVIILTEVAACLLALHLDPPLEFTSPALNYKWLDTSQTMKPMQTSDILCSFKGTSFSRIP